MNLHTKRDLERAAAKYGATVDDQSDGRSWAFLVDAPAGYRWQGDFIHTISASAYKGRREWLDGLIRDIEERMAYGLEKCPEPNCDVCES